MHLKGIDIVHALIDGLDSNEHLSQEEYYLLNHLSADDLDKIAMQISIPVREALFGAGIATI